MDTNLKSGMIKLVSAALASVAACFFVVIYSWASRWRWAYEQPGAQMISGTQFLVTYGNMAFVFPVSTFLLGIYLLILRPDRRLAFEATVATTWLLSLVWAGGCLLLWQIQYVPIFTRMHWHY